MVIVIAAGEKGGHHKKVILSSKLKNYAPVFLLFSLIFSYFPPIFSGEKILFSYFSGRTMCWAPCTCARSKVLCVAIVTSRSWMGLWRHCWRRQWLGRVHCTDWEWDLCLECPRFDSRRSYLSYFHNYFIFHVIKGIKNGCPCIVEIRGT